MRFDAEELLGHTLDAWRDRGGDAACYRTFFRTGTQADVLPPVSRVSTTRQEYGTCKFLLEHADGQATESVILPQEGRTGRIRRTLCVSSQVGCAMGCTFCQTATMGRVRNLTAAEIVAQWFHARHHLDTEITNIVFMGMGEPMDNLDAVIGAIEVLVDRNGPSIAASRIGVSTVGHARGIRRLARLITQPGLRQVRLAVSVNASDDDTRRSIMPIARAVDMAELRRAMDDWIAAGGKPVLIEYVLIPGVNDDPDMPAQLKAYLEGLPCRVNVIPYNPRDDSPWPAPGEDAVAAFIDAVAATGLAVNRRRTMGRSVMAACGQLGTAS